MTIALSSEIKPLVISIDERTFQDSVTNFKMHLGSRAFYNSLRLFDSDSIIGICPVGEERSREFNIKMDAAGFVVAHVTNEGRNDPDSAVFNLHGGGVPTLTFVMALSEEGTLLEANKLKVAGFDKGITRLEIFTQPWDFNQVNRVAQALKRISEKYGILPILVDLIVEENVQKANRDLGHYITSLIPTAA